MAKNQASAEPNPAPAPTGTDPFADCYDAEPPKGLKEVGNPDIDGWWQPKAGLVFQGTVVGWFRITDKNQKERSIVIVRLAKPTAAILDKQPIRLEAGKHLAVGISYRLQELLSYIENHGEVWARALEKKDIGGGHSMWQYDLRARGTKAPPPTAAMAAQGADGDDIPF